MSTTSNSATKTKLEDHIYRVGSTSQASDYVTITRFIIAHVTEKYTKGGTEVAWALENKQENDISASEPVMAYVTPAAVNVEYPNSNS